ncbi:YcbK family protein [Pseudomonas tritici]|uniref:YcbK family protein n=1 Tax=Pseudomonas tritici TaxID=2745518 RepID=UPI00387AB494
MQEANPQSRRQFLSWGLRTAAVAVAIAVAPPFTLAAPQKDWRQVLLDRDRWLSLERVKTGEKAQFRYYRYGVGFEPEGYKIACHLLRDVESGGITISMSPRLLDLLYLIQGWLRINKLPFHIKIMSGYRTPAYNATLAKAAKKSEHVNGNAADIRIDGLSVESLDRLAKAIGVGGVGFYPQKKGFVHVDVGRLRNWKG